MARSLEPGKQRPRPRGRIKAAAVVDTVIAVLFLVMGIYHFTQPDQAWRSGAIEMACSVSLLGAAYLLGRRMALLVHAVIIMGTLALGIRHLTFGGGWKSGVAEISISAILSLMAGLVYARQPK